MTTPRLTLIRQVDTHRLIPTRYRPDGASVLTRIADDDHHLQDIFDLDHATNDRLVAENDLLPGIGLGELVSGVPHYRVVNAAFCHARPEGSRFNGPERGAWYAGFELETARAEVIFHKTLALAEIDWFTDSVTYDDYLADFSGAFHDLRNDPEFAPCLAPDSYIAAQTLAADLLADQSRGVVYPCVRASHGTNLACFRPALVAHVRRAHTYRFTWTGTPQPDVTVIDPDAAAQPLDS